MESRFEVLEEETHYPVTGPKGDEKDAANQLEVPLEGKEVETLEQQLERLVLSVKNEDVDEIAPVEKTVDVNKTENVKKASSAKELGNKCVYILWCFDQTLLTIPRQN